MSDYLALFERECAEVGISPRRALEHGGVHPSLWGKWKSGAVSPTLRNFEAARGGLAALRRGLAKNRDETATPSEPTASDFRAAALAAFGGIDLDLPARKIDPERVVDL
ncbi:MAG: hypothetical protein JWM33_582 [Caulobacteraceae bacterium]|nr:hypothetical protein [Caulobacteraceae bacterium]